MVDFRKIISPRSQSQLQSVRDELAIPRSNAEMAEWLVGMARELRQTGRFHADHSYSYDEWALFRVIPELAVRLDPAAARLAEEMPQEVEKRDMKTYVADTTDARLGEMVASIIANGSFGRGRSETEDSRADRIVDMLHIHRGERCPLSQAKNRLAGHPDPVFEEDERAPLPGSYLIASTERRDHVLMYSEDPAELDRGLAAIKLRVGGEIIEDDQDAAMVRKMMRFRRDRELKDWDAISIQEFSGEIRVLYELKVEADPAPCF